MKKILCFGDSNTWGWNPATKERFGENTRWTGVLQNELKGEYKIIEEGLNGRTTVWDDPIDLFKNGSKQLPPCLETHRPLDIVLLMLGTNDLKNRFSVSAYDIANGIDVLINQIMNSKSTGDLKAPQILLVCPPQVVATGEFKDTFIGAEEKSAKLDFYYSQIAEAHKIPYINSDLIIKSSSIDGIHLEASQHDILGKLIAKEIKKLF